jgi:hypothetical protein
LLFWLRWFWLAIRLFPFLSSVLPFPLSFKSSRLGLFDDSASFSRTSTCFHFPVSPRAASFSPTALFRACLRFPTPSRHSFPLRYLAGFLYKAKFLLRPVRFSLAPPLRPVSCASFVLCPEGLLRSVVQGMISFCQFGHCGTERLVVLKPGCPTIVMSLII